MNLNGIKYPDSIHSFPLSALWRSAMKTLLLLAILLVTSVWYSKVYKISHFYFLHQPLASLAFDVDIDQKDNDGVHVSAWTRILVGVKNSVESKTRT